ncbi:MAG: phosphotransferase enzyme family protein [Phycisphaerales bacterium]
MGDVPDEPAGTPASPEGGAVRREAVLEALRRFGIAEARVRILPRGSRRAPKFLVEHRGGRLLLKRRRPNGGAASELGAEIQAALAERGFRVPAIRRDLEGRSVAVVEGAAWELVEFVEGDRYPRTAKAASSAGAMLATLHRALEAMWTPEVRHASYHDSPLVRRTLEGVAEDAAASLDADRLRQVKRFADRYEQAAAAVRPVWPEIPRSLLHGDFHPGNLLFDEEQVVAVLDWEAVREDAPLAEFASAAFHFALPAKLLAEDAPLPDGLRLDLLAAFAAGYGGVPAGLGAIVVELAAEAAIAEAGFLLAGVTDGGRLRRIVEAIESMLRSLEDQRDAIVRSIERPRRETP